MWGILEWWFEEIGETGGKESVADRFFGKDVGVFEEIFLVLADFLIRFNKVYSFRF